jgi:outer membrane protein, heavy metal efflux system
MLLKSAFRALLVAGLSLLTVVEMSAACANRSALAKSTCSDERNGASMGPASGDESEGSAMGLYFDAQQGVPSLDLVRRAIASNAELAAARLEIERSRARLRQAGLRPNPTVDFGQSTGRFTGSRGDRETSIGFVLPLEVGRKRQRRIDLARAELDVAEAEIADRERRLAAEVRVAYAEASAYLRELEITEQLNDNDVQTARIVEVRVTEGDSARIELSLIQVEVARLRSHRALIQGRLEAALLRLKSLAGIPPEEPLRLRETLATSLLPEPPTSIEQAVDIARGGRPDLRLARMNERAADAELGLAQAGAIPDVLVSTRYSLDRSMTDLPKPLASFPDRSSRLSFGVSLELPFSRRNQGARDEAIVAVFQARRRREFAEQRVRYEVASAYKRYEASRAALATFEQGVLGRSALNIDTIREAFRLGAFRVTDVLTEQRRLIDSQREYIELLTERHRALIDLHAAIASPIQ